MVVVVRMIVILKTSIVVAGSSNVAVKEVVISTDGSLTYMNGQ